jgi:uncharacterized membrane protein YczE
MSRIKPVWIKKSLIYVLGLFILALGIAFSVKSNLGVSPVSSIPYVLSQISGLSLGMMTAVIYILNMAVQAAVLRREYKPHNLLQIGVSFLFGYFTDAALWLMTFLPVTENYVIRIIYLVLGVSCIAFGVFCYLTTSLLALPTDGTVQAISHKGRFRLHMVKITYDCVSTGLAIIVSLAVLGNIGGIGIGTVAASLGVGRLLGIFTKLLRNRLLRFINGAAKNPASQPEGPCPEIKTGCRKAACRLNTAGDL